jgi:O-antigen/teichoic acid export membrane protein
VSVALKQRFISGACWGAFCVISKGLLGLLLIPAIVSRLSVEHYGLYALLIAIAELPARLDAAMSPGLIHRLGRLAMQERPTDVSETLACTRGLYASLGLVLLLAGLSGLQFLAFLQPLPSQAESSALGLLLLAEVLIGIIGCFFRTVLLAHSLHRITNAADLTHGLISHGLGCILLLSGHGLVSLLCIRLLTSLFRMIFLALQTRPVEPHALCLRMAVSSPILQELMTINGSALLNQLCLALSCGLDAFIIAAFLGLSEAAAYTLVTRVFGQIPSLIFKCAEGLFPLFLKLDACTESREAQTIFLRASSFIHFLTLSLLFLLALYYAEISAFLSGQQLDVSVAHPIIAALMPILWSSVVVFPAQMLLFAKRRFRFQNTLNVIASSCNFLLSLLLVKQWGAVGVLLGGLLPHLVEHQIFLIPQACRELQLRYADYCRAVWLNGSLPFLVGLLLVLIGHTLAGPYARPFPMRLCISLIAGLVGSGLWLQATASPAKRAVIRDRLNGYLAVLAQHAPSKREAC